MTSRKISEFNSQTTISDPSLVTFVVNGTNVNIPFSDFKNVLGVTGTLNQVGDPLGAPVLETIGTTNNIRNLESSKGVIASVSAQNGINLSCNFTQTSSGFNVIDDLNDDIYKFKSFIAGTNIGLNDDGESITINFNPDSSSSKTIPVSSESDLPDPVGGVITLGDFDYLFLDDLVTSNRFVVGGNTTIRAASSQLIKLEYTGTGTMFTGSNINFRIDSITISAPNGQLYDFSAATPVNIFQFVEANVESCNTVGSFNNMFIVRISAIGWEDIKTNGMVFSGIIANFDLPTSILFLNGGTFVDLGTALFGNLSIDKQVIQATSEPAATFLSGLPNSGNITPNSVATINANRVSVLTTPLSGVSPSDVRYEFFENSGIPDSISDSLMYVEGSSTETVITTQGVKVKVENLWTDEDTSRFTFDSDGRLTYIGERNSRLPIDITSTCLFAAGGDKQLELCLAINGSLVTPTCKQSTASSSKAASITTVWQHDFSNGDYVEVFVSNESNTDNIIVQQAIVRIN